MLVTHINEPITPSEVLDKIVQAISVNVINLGEFFWIWDKHLCDKSMDCDGLSYSGLSKTYIVIIDAVVNTRVWL